MSIETDQISNPYSASTADVHIWNGFRNNPKADSVHFDYFYSIKYDEDMFSREYR